MRQTSQRPTGGSSSTRRKEEGSLMATVLQKPRHPPQSCSSAHLSPQFLSSSPSSSSLKVLHMEEDNSGAAKKAAIWDCGSSLYDSFELQALERQLASTIASRSNSMPHPSDPAAAPRRPPRKPSKISRSAHGLLRVVFRVGAGAAAPADFPPPPPPPHGCVHMGRGYRGVRPHGGVDGGVADASGKKGAVAAAEQLGPAVRKTASDRFRGIVPVVSRIYCH